MRSLRSFPQWELAHMAPRAISFSLIPCAAEPGSDLIVTIGMASTSTIALVGRRGLGFSVAADAEWRKRICGACQGVSAAEGCGS